MLPAIAHLSGPALLLENGQASLLSIQLLSLQGCAIIVAEPVVQTNAHAVNPLAIIGGQIIGKGRPVKRATLFN